MGLLNLLRRVNEQPLPEPNALPSDERRFTTDRSRMFNLDQTRQLDALFQVPAPQRDSAWIECFYDAAWSASISVSEPAHFDGPDGYPYYRLNLPPADVAFDSQSLGNIARECLERNAGVAFFASSDDPESQPQFVLSMGVLDSLLRFDSAQGDPIDRDESVHRHNPAMFDVEKTGTSREVLITRCEHTIMTGSPSRDFLPTYTARALYRYMTRIWGVEDPRVHLMVHAQMRPSRNLVIGRKGSSFESEGEIADEIARLFWFLPPKRALILMPEDWSFDRMDRLADLFE